MEYYSPIKRNEAATTRMDIENIVLSERSYKRSHTVGFHLYEISRIDKPTEIESKLAAARGWRMVEWEVTSNV